MNAITKLIDRIRQIKADLIANREAEVLRIALDQLALTKLRIQTKGQAHTGSAFAPYVPQYAKSRGKAGYQTQYVDFTRTGRLWANIAPVVVDSNVFSATVQVGAQDLRGQNILKGAEKKRGNIVRPSAAEIELTRKANRERIKKYLKL